MVKELAGNELSDRSNTVCSSSNNIKYKGVRKRKWGKYVSEIRLPNSRERIWLGSYDTAEKAARAFDAAQFCLRGSTANFNFPNNKPDIVGARSLNSSEIQLAAARFAQSEPVASESDQIGNVDSTMSCSTSSKSDPLNLRVESPSTSVTAEEFSVNNEFTNIPLDKAFLESDFMGSESNLVNFGMFPGFDEFFVPSIAGVNIDEDNCEGFSNSHDSFLWNF